MALDLIGRLNLGRRWVARTITPLGPHASADTPLHWSAMVLDVALVGTGGMLPLPKRWLSSVLLRYRRHLILFDCGEGTQISLRALGWGIKDIDLILISHVHGDHISGLPGLLLSQGNSERTQPVRIAGPSGLRAVVDGLLVVARFLPFKVHVQELAKGEHLELDDVRVSHAAAEHHVPCLAYRLDVPRGRRFQAERATALGVAVTDWKRLQHGQSVGSIEPEQVLGPPRRGLSVGLVTDTRPTQEIERLVRGVDLLVCEGTYGSDEDQARAVERRHMTFREAAGLAARAGVGQLVLTHFSPSVVDPESFAHNAKEVFAPTTVGQDHLSMSLRFPSE
jgi:ribonuclease Z